MFENLDWQEVIARYDGPQSLFYLDPPYWGGENDYGKGLFDRGQFTLMAEILAGIEGAFLLSINDTPETREIFGRFHIEAVRLTYSVASAGGTEARELIISNREARVGLF